MLSTHNPIAVMVFCDNTSSQLYVYIGLPLASIFGIPPLTFKEMIPSQKSKQETLLVSELLIEADNAKLLLIL